MSQPEAIGGDGNVLYGNHKKSQIAQWGSLAFFIGKVMSRPNAK